MKNTIQTNYFLIILCLLVPAYTYGAQDNTVVATTSHSTESEDQQQDQQRGRGHGAGATQQVGVSRIFSKNTREEKASPFQHRRFPHILNKTFF